MWTKFKGRDDEQGMVNEEERKTPPYPPRPNSEICDKRRGTKKKDSGGISDQHPGGCWLVLHPVRRSIHDSDGEFEVLGFGHGGQDGMVGRLTATGQKTQISVCFLTGITQAFQPTIYMN